jgi:hypothetical protein
MSEIDPPGPPVEGWPEESAQRLAKAKALRDRGVNPYPNRYQRTHTFAEIIAAYGEKTLEELDALAVTVRVAGRVVLKRPQGKVTFATLSDGESRLQVYLRKDELGDEAYTMFEDLVDLGDFVGVAGRVMRTRKGELSVQAKELTFLSKALLPPPEKWHGLADVEARYRQRYLDLMANPEVRRTFVAERDDRGDPPLPGQPGLRRGRDADDAAHRGRGDGAPVRDAPQRPRHRPLPAHRPRALPEAAGGGRPREGLRDQPQLPQRRHLLHAQPGVHDAGFYTATFDCADVIAVTEELVAAAAQRVSGGAPGRLLGPGRSRSRGPSSRSP